MEATKKSTRKSGNKASEDKIRTAYQEHLLTHGRRPVSVFKFCLDLGIREEEFYNHFGSFEGLERDVWNSYIDKTLQRLHADEAFAGFSTREKVLAFYFTLLEEFKAHRSFILLQFADIQRLEIVPGFLKSFKHTFEDFISSLVQEGKGTGEVATRPFIDKRYPQLFWLHMAFILTFWKNDDSPAFEKTDAAVEKSVNLAFDLIGKGAVDAAIDFGKFLYQQRMK